MSHDSGLIKVHIPVQSGKRATRVKLPGDCTLIDAVYGGLSQPKAHRGSDGYLHLKRKATAGAPQVELQFRLVEAYGEPVERLFRVVRIEDVADLGLEAGRGRSLGTIAQVNGPDGQLAWEVIEMLRYDVGTRVSDIQTMRMTRGLNRLVFQDHVVVRVNGCEVCAAPVITRQAGRAPLQWELRYQTRRQHKGMVGWSFIGTSADEARSAIPAALTVNGPWRELRPGLFIWLSANLLEVANAG